MTSSRPVIDFHAHFVPGFCRDAAIAAGHGHPDGMPGFPRWSVGEALDMMGRGRPSRPSPPSPPRSRRPRSSARS